MRTEQMLHMATKAMNESHKSEKSAVLEIIHQAVTRIRELEERIKELESGRN